MVWCGPLHLTSLGDVAYECINIQQVAEEEEEEEDTPHVDTWRNARVWIAFFGGALMTENYDIREREM
jgi:hypothetical protein